MSLPLKCLLALSALFTLSCVHTSGGAWRIDSAPLPEGWPELTPVGEVALREYPAVRAAVVEDDAAASSEEVRSPLFMQLFRHIQAEDIAMTAPVAMGYADDAVRMESMAFLYRHTGQGATGPAGAVEVRDSAPATFASVGVRGDYDDETFAEGKALLDAWLAAPERAWVPAGPPRFLGYNGPFVPWFLRYGEVQVPVTRRAEG